jgi:hypothetical protein
LHSFKEINRFEFFKNEKLNNFLFSTTFKRSKSLEYIRKNHIFQIELSFALEKLLVQNFVKKIFLRVVFIKIRIKNLFRN